MPMITSTTTDHSIKIREALEGVMDRIEPGQHNEAIAEACISASEYLVWAAEMAATGRMADGSMARATLIKEARAKLDEAERIMHLSYRAAQHRRRPVAYLVAAE